VEAPREMRLSRLVARGIRADDAERRMAQQATDEQRRTIATWVIDNSGDLDALAARVDEIWLDVVRSATADPEPPAADAPPE
jgi:dephospho-CoA kinase